MHSKNLKRSTAYKSLDRSQLMLPDNIIMGHRGIPVLALENTMEAFKAIKEHTIAGVEFDIRLCKSGELVVFHDKNLRRLASIDTDISKLSYNDLSKITITNGTFSGRIPLLADVLDLLGPDVWLDIEVKSEKIHDQILEDTLIELLKNYPNHKLLISSFNPFRIRNIKKKAPELVCGFIHSKSTPFWLKPLGYVISRADFYKPDFRDIKRPNSKKRICWTVDSIDDAAAMFDLGITAVISNKPHELLAALSK